MPGSYLQSYLPVLLHGAFVLIIAGGMLALSSLLGRHAPTPAKLMPYESGMVPVGDTRQRFSVKFYLVAMLFILFDVEAVFLYPWAVILRELKLFGLVEMVIYMVLIFSGFVYVWKKGALDWSQAGRGE